MVPSSRNVNVLGWQNATIVISEQSVHDRAVDMSPHRYCSSIRDIAPVMFGECTAIALQLKLQYLGPWHLSHHCKVFPVHKVYVNPDSYIKFNSFYLPVYRFFLFCGPWKGNTYVSTKLSGSVYVALQN